MGCIFSRNDEPNINIHDCILPSNESDYQRPHNTISVSSDRIYNIPIVDIRFDGWYENSIRLWPKHTEQREHFLLLARTALQTPGISGISSSDEDKDFDTVF